MHFGHHHLLHSSRRLFHYPQRDKVSEDTVTITIRRENAEVLRQIEWALPYNFAVALQAALEGER